MRTLVALFTEQAVVIRQAAHATIGDLARNTTVAPAVREAIRVRYALDAQLSRFEASELGAPTARAAFGYGATAGSAAKGDRAAA
jgi:hypothetical protein